MAKVDIFNPQESVIAKGLEGKAIMIYGGNNVGKTYVATRMSKPYVILTESGLNAQSGVKYNRINKWSEFLSAIDQFTSPKTVEKAREMYDTIVIDEVYAASLLCQDFVIETYGDGALTLGDSEGKINLYQQYERNFFKAINKLLSCDYTVVFIGHATEKKDGQIYPKGDKRCLNPIIDNCDFVLYVHSNGVDENGNLIRSSAYLTETKEYFARSRFEHCPPCIEEFSAENLEAAVVEAIEKDELINHSVVTTYQEQKTKNTGEVVDFDLTLQEVKNVGKAIAKAGFSDAVTEVVEGILGVGKRVVDCSKRQVDALVLILTSLKAKGEELGVEL